MPMETERNFFFISLSFEIDLDISPPYNSSTKRTWNKIFYLFLLCYLHIYAMFDSFAVNEYLFTVYVSITINIQPCFHLCEGKTLKWQKFRATSDQMIFALKIHIYVWIWTRKLFLKLQCVCSCRFLSHCIAFSFHPWAWERVESFHLVLLMMLFNRNVCG